MERYSWSGRQTHFCAVHSQKSAKLLEYIFFRIPLAQETRGALRSAAPWTLPAPPCRPHRYTAPNRYGRVWPL